VLLNQINNEQIKQSLKTTSSEECR